MSHYTSLRVGAVLPVEGRWRITGQPLDTPEWYALRVRGESKAKAKLEFAEVEVAYPVERDIRFKNGQRVERLKPVIPGLIYAKFRAAPMWHVLKERGIITGVVCRDQTPIILPPDIIRRVMGLPTEAERLAAAKAELLRVREGDKARILSGPLAGMVVDVRSMRGSRVWWAAGFVKGEAEINGIERILPLAP